MTQTILDRIVRTKQAELRAAMRRKPLESFVNEAQTAPPTRNFAAAVTSSTPSGVQLIAEIKQASPSAGIIRTDFDPVSIAKVYALNGAAALSVLTDQTYFHGRLDDIRRVRDNVFLPVLRKDFLMDPYQIYESRAAGADAVLLIAAILSTEQIVVMHRIACELGMDVLIEVHSEDQLTMVLGRLGNPSERRYLLGINNRDLGTQKTDLGVTDRLARCIPPNTPFVSESGIASREDVLRLQEIGVSAILVGEAILRERDLGSKMRELLGMPPSIS